ncbi:TetR/AcrR family transcriptional regulator [Clostridium sp. LY3-2]|uniref:TetR/AcrR family transcriptional regulator n=1 Tax=Clostridium TaxID=1485 RepID=UPI0018831D3A|nr:MULTISPECIES: TetR/AcrR family transcriptional regulator [Clostridium]MCR6514445.1 TetR/AcrR family transcriptional regulator [Clostridium sp. LY3-2]
MNQKFFNLPTEKQNTIINAGYRVFSENKYKKSPISEIALEAGISKSLIFHYFKNKKELYLYLYQYGVEVLMKEAVKTQVFEEKDFFKLYLEGAKCKFEIFKKHKYLFNFMVRVYYEEDDEIRSEIEGKNESLINYKNNLLMNNIDMYKFKDDIDIKNLDKMLNWCTEGYMKENYRDGNLDLDVLIDDFSGIIDFFRKNSYKEEYLR